MSDEPRDEIYDVTLMLNHPNEKPDAITNGLGLQPDCKWQAGQPPGHACREAAAGREPGHVLGLLRTDCRAPEVFRNRGEAAGPAGSGGGVRVGPAPQRRAGQLDRPPAGHANIGDVIAPADLLRTDRLGIGLDVEVFPDMR